MKFESREIIIIESNTGEVQSLFGDEERTFVTIEDKGYALKKVLNSNTHLLIQPNISLVKNVYELHENVINYPLLNTIFIPTKKLHATTPDTTPDVVKHTSLLDLRSAINIYQDGVPFISKTSLTQIFGYGAYQLHDIERSFLLIQVNDEFCIRPPFKELRRLSMMVHNTRAAGGAMDDVLALYPACVGLFVKNQIAGTVAEMCAFALAEFAECGEIEKFKVFMEEMVYVDIDFGDVRTIIDRLYCVGKEEIYAFLETMRCI